MPPARGRPRLTPEDVSLRVAEYCDRYGVRPTASGLPPFPAGQRETQQHREWMAVYRAHSRLAEPARSVETPPPGPQSELPDRAALLAAQRSRCPVCDRNLELDEASEYSGGGRLRAVLHPGCNRLASLAEAIGPESLDRIRGLLWPGRSDRKPSKT
jgi:hypothetical protein